MFWGTVSCSMLSIEHQRSVGCRYSLIAFEGSPAEAALRSGSEGTTVSNDWQKWNSRSRFVSKSVSTFLCLISQQIHTFPTQTHYAEIAVQEDYELAERLHAKHLGSLRATAFTTCSWAIRFISWCHSPQTVYAKRCQEGLFWTWLRFCIIHGIIFNHFDIFGPVDIESTLTALPIDILMPFVGWISWVSWV